jgi:hypothetical protein
VFSSGTDRSGLFGGRGSFATKANAYYGEVGLAKYESYVGLSGEPYDPFSQIPKSLLGSGGGGSSYGDGCRGGGAIIIRAHTIRIDGTVTTCGASSIGSSGSGGLVLIVAEHVLGDGQIEAAGGYGECGFGPIIIRSPDVRGKFQINAPNAAFKIENNLNFPDLGSLPL